MLKHLFLALAPLYFVYLLRSYCCCCSAPHLQQTEGNGVEGGGGSGGSMGDGVDDDSSGMDGAFRAQGRGVRTTKEGSEAPSTTEPEPKEEMTCATGFPHNRESVQRGGVQEQLCFKRLGALGSVVLCVFLSAVGPLCVSGGWAQEACVKQLEQLGTRLFPFGRQASTSTFDLCVLNITCVFFLYFLYF